MPQIAPGVYTKIIDQSIFATAVPGTVGFIPIMSEKGVDNELLPVGSQSELVNKFGTPNMSKYGQSLYNAFNFLAHSSNLYVIRPLPTVEDTAELLDLFSQMYPVVYPYSSWVNKPATFAGCVIGYIEKTDHSDPGSVNSPTVLGKFYQLVDTNRSAPFTMDISPIVYTVGEGSLRVYINGTELMLGASDGYTEVGLPGESSSTIQIERDVSVGDSIIVLKVSTTLLRSYGLANPTKRYVLIPRQPNPYGDPNSLYTFVEKESYTAVAGTDFSIEGDPPYTVYTPFTFVPGQKQIQVELNGSPLSQYKELPMGNGIQVLVSLTEGDTIVVEKEGTVYLTRYRAEFLDPITDTKVTHNLRDVCLRAYKMAVPNNNTWLKPYWTYTNTSFGSSIGTDCTFVPLIVFAAKGRGQAYNNLKIYIRPVLNMEKHYELSVVSSDPLFNLETTLETFIVSFIPGTTSAPGESSFVEDVVNTYSNFIQCYTNPEALTTLANLMDPIGDFGYFDGDLYITSKYFDPSLDTPPTILDRLLGTLSVVDISTKTSSNRVAFTLDGGHEGCLLSVDNKSVVGPVFEKIFANACFGLYDRRVIDSEDNDISVIFDANFPRAVKDALYQMALIRGDSFVFLDLGAAPDVATLVDQRNKTYAYNSYLVALYAPHSKVYSTFEGKEITVAPSYHLCRVVPYNDSVGELWFAPAGSNRASLVGIRRFLVNITTQDLDLLYANQINPLMYKSKVYQVYGQLTSQRRSSALSDVNIVRLILYLRKTLERTLSGFLFEQNDQLTWALAKAAVEGFLASIATRRGLYSYAVEVGATEYEIKNKTFHVNVTIQPTRTTEKILLNFIVR